MEQKDREQRDREQQGIGRRRFLKAAAVGGAAVGGAAVGGAALGRLAGGFSAQAAAAQQIPQRPLGRTGATIPILQLGTSQRLDETYDRVMHRCYQEGVRAFDTALSYGWGSSHRAIRNFLTQIKNRPGMWLTSKSGSGTAARLAGDLDQALAELGTDYLDLFLMHGIDDPAMLAPAFLQAGEKMRKSGKTRFFGFSCHDGNVAELMQRAAQVGGIDVILFRYNFRRYGDLALNRAMDACHKAGIGLVAMKTSASVPAAAEKVVRFRSGRFTLGQAKLKSVWADERIASLLSEMDSIQIARENIAAARSPHALTAGEAHQLNRLAAATAHLACNGCAQFCEGALGGQVAIADRLRFLMYYEAYGDPERARRLYRALPEPGRARDGAELSAAAAACPQGIDIAGRLAEAHRLLA